MKAKMRLIAVCAAATLAACDSKPVVKAAAPAPAPAPAASLHDIMKNQIAPAADVVWKSVGAVDDKEIKPETDADWKKVRDAAQVLVDAPNLLLKPGLQIVNAGAKIQDEGQEGNLSVAEMQKRIAANQAEFAAFARNLQTTATAAVAAAEKKDVNGITDVGGRIDEACEACHARFWYPGSAQ
jgi:uncharacterized small protein (DUF1192 family)